MEKITPDDIRYPDLVEKRFNKRYAGKPEYIFLPVPNEQTDGCMINHPDTDLTDAQWNQSGIPWFTFYYKENYPRLQQVKAKWDPLNIFYHALSIQAGPAAHPLPAS